MRMISSSRSRGSSAPSHNIETNRSLTARATRGWRNSTWKMLSSAMNSGRPASAAVALASSVGSHGTLPSVIV